MITLIPRQSASTGWQVATPVMAVLATMIAGGLLFAMLGHDPVAAIRTIFWDPLFGPAAGYSRPQLLIKAAPLILIASGLAIGFRAGIWNIGAEGQYIIGGITGAAVALALYPLEAWWLFPLMVAAEGYCCRLRDPGKPMPCGLRIGPKAIHAAIRCAT
jgi:ABC-type uncharacterized transport system permease subunit